VETGTYLGETIDFLARPSAMVYSLEPSDELYAICQKRFLNRQNVRLLHGTSEVIFPDLVRQLRGDVRFWLDGHASGGVTFQGKFATPVLEELRAIEQAMSNYSSTVVLIDDMRCLNHRIRSSPITRPGMNWLRGPSGTVLCGTLNTIVLSPAGSNSRLRASTLKKGSR